MDSTTDQSTDSKLECAVCLQECHHPTKLPCGHIFCFLCVKGIAIQNRKCAMCRAEIPSDYFNNPVLLEKITSSPVDENSDQYQWYYEGRNGWWRYDARSNADLEAAWAARAEECPLLLAGAVYCVDLAAMLQWRRSDPVRCRRVKRDSPALPAKGIAGIKIIEERSLQNKTESDDDESQHRESDVHDIQDGGEEGRAPAASSPALQTIEEDPEPLPESPEHIEINDLVATLETLNIEPPPEGPTPDELQNRNNC